MTNPLLPQTKTPYNPAAPVANRRTRTSSSGTTLKKYGTASAYISPQMQQWIVSQMRLDPSLYATPGSQLQQQARAQVMPYFNQLSDYIRNQIAARGKQGSAAITGYMGEYAKRAMEAAGSINQGYDQALGRQGTLNDALTNFVRSQGQESSNQLAAAEAQAGQNSAGSDMLGQIGAGAAGAQAGMGYGAMSQLISDAAAAKQYGATLPVQGYYQGAQMLNQLQGSLGEDLNSQLGQLRTQIPLTMQQVYASLMDREMQKAGLRQSNTSAIAQYLADAQKFNAQSSMWQSEFGANQQQRSVENWQRQQGLDQQNMPEPVDWNARIGEAQQALQTEAARLIYGVQGQGPLGQPIPGRPVLKGNDPQRRIKFIKRMTAYVMTTVPGTPKALASAWATQMANSMGVVNGKAKTAGQPSVPVGIPGDSGEASNMAYPGSPGGNWYDPITQGPVTDAASWLWGQVPGWLQQGPVTDFTKWLTNPLRG